MSKCPNCFYEADSWNDFVSINNVLECPECEEHFILEARQLAEKPKLSIPKKIAEIFEKYDEREFESFEEEEFWIEENGLTKWIYDSESNQLMTAYLNPLTRTFVEVTGE